MRILAEIVDVDENSVSSSEETIMSERPILLLRQPLPPSLRQNYVQESFFSSILLNLTFQYRVICSAGTYGSDCLQTSNCQPFPSCVPITCADSPCMNGGTCSNVSEFCIRPKNVENTFSNVRRAIDLGGGSGGGGGGGGGRRRESGGGERERERGRG